MTAPKCHRCDYDLSGLPEVHACPECGLQYDAHTVGWKYSPQGWGMGLGANIFSCLATSIWGSIALGGNGWRSWFGWLILAGAASSVVSAMILWRRKSSRSWVAVALHPEGIYVKALGDPQLIPWANVESIYVARAMPVWRILAVRTTSDGTFELGRLLTKQDRRAFVESVGPAHARYKQPDWPGLVIVVN